MIVALLSMLLHALLVILSFSALLLHRRPWTVFFFIGFTLMLIRRSTAFSLAMSKPDAWLFDLDTAYLPFSITVFLLAGMITHMRAMRRLREEVETHRRAHDEARAETQHIETREIE